MTLKNHIKGSGSNLNILCTVPKNNRKCLSITQVKVASYPKKKNVKFTLIKKFIFHITVLYSEFLQAFYGEVRVYPGLSESGFIILHGSKIPRQSQGLDLDSYKMNGWTGNEQMTVQSFRSWFYRFYF